MLDSTEREDKTLEAVLVTVLRGRKGIRMGTSEGKDDTDDVDDDKTEDDDETDDGVEGTVAVTVTCAAAEPAKSAMARRVNLMFMTKLGVLVGI